MPEAPDTYRPPWRKHQPESKHSFHQRDDSDNLRAFYHSAQWRRFRARQYERHRAMDAQRIHQIYQASDRFRFAEYVDWLQSDAPLCVDCLREFHITPANTLDHIKQIRHGGGRTDPDNVQWLCKAHHNMKSGKEAHK